MPPRDNNTTMQRQALRKTFLSERENLESMRKWPHPNILAMLGSFERSVPPSFNLIFPFTEGGSLFNFMRLEAFEHEDPNQVYPHSSIICDEYAAWEHGILDECLGLLDGLSYIHHGIQGNLIMHRDIKPANILIHNRKFVLADFGEAHIKATYEGATSKTRKGAWTPAYSPPELFQPNIDETEVKFGRGSDVWGLGCVLLELVVMLAHIRHEHVPSVVEFEDLRISWSTGNGHGSDKYPANAFAGNKCIDEVVFMISNLEDPHLTILLEVAQMMLVDDWAQRPRASKLHTRMKQTYTLLRESTSHFQQETTSIASAESEQQPNPMSDLPAPEALASFWYQAFLKNNHRYYYWLCEVPYALLCLVLVGLAIALVMCIAQYDNLTKMGKDVDAIFYAILYSIGGLGVTQVLLFIGPPLFNWCLVLCVFRPQAYRYVKARADVSRGTASQDQPRSSLHSGLLLSGRWCRSVWSWMCKRSESSFNGARRRRLR
jgi:serine/threonine protein kinase